METKQEKLREVKTAVGPIDLPRIDVEKYVGTRTKIKSAKTMLTAEGKYLLRVETDVVGKEKGTKSDIEIRGSALFGLHEDGNGNIGWGPDTKAGKFMARMKATQPEQLVGRDVVLQLQQNNPRFLTFV